VNDVGEGSLSAPVSHYAMSPPETPAVITLVSSVMTSVSAASATVSWVAVTDTGGVPLTGYKVYTTMVSTGIITLAYDGTNMPEVRQTTITNLVLNQQYEIQLTAINLVESAMSSPLLIIAAGLPDSPGAISEAPNSRTGSSIGL